MKWNWSYVWVWLNVWLSDCLEWVWLWPEAEPELSEAEAPVLSAVTDSVTVSDSHDTTI